MWAMPETRPVCLLDARCAGFCVRGTDVRGRDQVLLCEIMCIHDVGSLTLPLLYGVALERICLRGTLCALGALLFVDLGSSLLYRGGEW